MTEEKMFWDKTDINAPSTIQQIAQCKDGNCQFEGQERRKQTKRGSTFSLELQLRQISLYESL
jgi:hypothetical protein